MSTTPRLVLRDASRFLGEHETLKDPTLPWTGYEFKKPYTKEHEDLCASVAGAFARTLANCLVPSYHATTIQRSREAFVRRLVVAHTTIGYYYLAPLTVEPGAPQSWRSTQSVIHTPTRAPGALLRASSEAVVTSREVIKRVLPLAVSSYVHLVARGADRLDAIVELRARPWVQLTRKAIRAIEAKSREEEVRKIMREVERAVGKEVEPRFIHMLSQRRREITDPIAWDMVLAVYHQDLLGERTSFDVFMRQFIMPSVRS